MEHIENVCVNLMLFKMRARGYLALVFLDVHPQERSTNNRLYIKSVPFCLSSRKMGFSEKNHNKRLCNGIPEKSYGFSGLSEKATEIW